MKISASSILYLDADLKINPKDIIQILGFEEKYNSEVVELLHISSGKKFYKNMSEINFLIERENYDYSE